MVHKVSRHHILLTTFYKQECDTWEETVKQTQWLSLLNALFIDCIF